MKDICMSNLERTTQNFLNDTLDSQDKKIVELLKGVIVIEKETITSERLYNQLKENYLDSDEQTIDFVNKLYMFDNDTICELLGMIVDELNNENLTQEEIDSKVNELIPTLNSINPELVNKLKEML